MLFESDLLYDTKFATTFACSLNHFFIGHQRNGSLSKGFIWDIVDCIVLLR